MSLERIKELGPSWHASTASKQKSMPQAEIAERVGKSLPAVKRAMKRLSDSGVIRRVGGKRFGKEETNRGA